MTIEWTPLPARRSASNGRYSFIDAKTRLLRQDAGSVLACLPGLLESGEHPKMRHELMQSTIE